MKYLALGFNLFCKNLLLNTIIIIQLTVALVLANIALGQINASYITLSYFESIVEEKGVYFMPSLRDILSGAVSGGEDRDRFEIIDDLKDVKEISIINSYTFQNKEGLFLTLGYDSFMANHIRLNLRRGVWFTDYLTGEDIIPVVVSSEKNGLKLGQTLSLNLYNHPNVQVKFKVVGVLTPSPYLLRYTTGGNIITCHDIFKRYNEDFYEMPMILLENEQLTQHVSRDQAREDVNRIIIFKETISEDDMSQNIAALSEQGFVQTIEKMRELGRKDAIDNIKLMLPFFIISFLISLVGIVSLNILNTYLNYKTFAIYYLCGSRWINCFYIILGYILWVVFLSISLLLVIYYLSVLTGSIYHLDFVIGANNLLLTVSLYQLVIFLTVLAPYRILKKTYPVEIIRGN